MASFEKNKKSGYWSVRFYDVDDNGMPCQRRISNKFKTKKEAQFAYEEYAEKRKEELKNKPIEQKAEEKRRMTFAEVTQGFLRHKKSRVKASSLYSIESRVNQIILPFFDGMAFEDITAIKIHEWIDTLSGYSDTYRDRMIVQLGSIMSYGEKYFDLKSNFKKIEKPKKLQPKKEMQIWNPDEFNQFIRFVDGEKMKMIYWTLYTLGLRIGEAIALSRNDVDFQKGTVKISKSYSQKQRAVTTTKNESSNRTVYAPKSYLQMLKKYKKEWDQQFPPDAPFIFGGYKPTTNNAITREKDRAVDASGVKRIRIHDLRHSYASLLLSNLVPIVAVSKQLGHATVTQTLDTYAHMMPSDQDALLSALGNIYAKK